MNYCMLIVDDEQIYRSSLAKLVARKYPQFTVVQAANGVEALAALEKMPVDCMFLDIRMPKMDGMELLEAMKQRGMQAVHTVIVSGYNDFSYARKALQFGAFDYLLKPMTPWEAENMVARLLEQLERETQERSDQQRLIKAAQQARPMLRVQLLQSLTEGIPDQQSIREKAALLELPLGGMWFRCACVRPERPVTEEWIIQAEKAMGCSLFPVHDHLLVLLFSAQERPGEGDTSEDVTQRLAQQLSQSEGPQMYGVGSWGASLSSIARSHGEALAMLEENSRLQALSGSHVTELVREYVEAHFQEPLSNAVVAEAMGYSTNYLSQTFKNETGCGLNEYIRDVRIQHAKQLLSRTAYKVTDIAAMVGIANNQYFGTVFRKVVGMTPKEYRETQNLEKAK